MYVDLLIIPMVESASSTSGPGSSVSAKGQHRQGSWRSQEHFSEIEPKEPLGTVLMITPCENINKKLSFKNSLYLSSDKGIFKMSSSHL